MHRAGGPQENEVNARERARDHASRITGKSEEKRSGGRDKARMTQGVESMAFFAHPYSSSCHLISPPSQAAALIDAIAEARSARRKHKTGEETRKTKQRKRQREKKRERKCRGKGREAAAAAGGGEQNRNSPRKGSEQETETQPRWPMRERIHQRGGAECAAMGWER